MLIGGIKFYDQSISNQVKTYDKISKVSMMKGDYYTIRCLLDYQYFKKNYQLVDNGLTNQEELDAYLKAIQQIQLYGIQITNIHNFKKDKRNNFEIW